MATAPDRPRPTSPSQWFLRLVAAAALFAAGLGSGYWIFKGSPPGQDLGDVPADRWALSPQPKDAFGDEAMKIVYLSQNWSPRESAEFYLSPHGSRLMPYTWLVALEQPGGEKRFLDPDHVRKLRYLPQRPSPGNPDGLPVGFVRDGKFDWVGLNCAACHTGQINYKGTGLRIDGAPAMGDLDGLLNGVIAALKQTRDDPAKFERFVKAVLKDDALITPEAKDALRAQMAEVLETREQYNARNDHGNDAASPRRDSHGYGRTDAFGAIMNQIVAEGLNVPENARKADAPVSYPFLWDTPQHDLVQWNGVARNFTLGNDIPVGALARNTGEVFGVFGELDLLEPRFVPPGYWSSVRFTGLLKAEDSLGRLWSPEWPKDVFGPIDAAAAAEGERLFAKHCVECHEPIKRTDPGRKVTAKLSPVDEVKTDPRMATNFANRRAGTGARAGTARRFDGKLGTTWEPEVHAVEVLKDATIGAILHDYLSRPRGSLAEIIKGGFPQSAKPGDLRRYKARPLNGIWATAPYLHNGSVPTLRQLLTPPEKREKTFWVGRLEFNPKDVGLVSDKVEGAFEYDTTKPGNSNAGHDYGAGLSEKEKDQLLEYLKKL